METSSIIEKLNAKWITPILAIVTGIYGFFFYHTNERLKTDSQMLQNIKDSLDISLRQKEFDNKLKLTIFEKVLEVASQKSDTNKQRIVTVMITEMLADHINYRDNMLQILNASQYIGDSLKIENEQILVADRKFDEKQFESKVEVQNQEKFRVDVFYLTKIENEAKPRAELIVNTINTKLGSNFNAVLRVLPATVNARSGYKIESNQIRFEEAERSGAEEILKLISDEKIFQLEQPALHVIKNKTPNYISIFVRNM